MKNKVDLGQSEEERAERKEIAELQKAIRDMQNDKRLLELRVTQGRGSTIEDQAQALLKGQGWVNPDHIGTQISQIDEAITVHERTLQLRFKRLSTFRSSRSRKVCDAAQAEYDAAFGRDIASDIRQLIDRLEQELAFVENLLEHDVEIGYLKRVLPRGGPRNLIELLKEFAAEAAK